MLHLTLQTFQVFKNRVGLCHPYIKKIAIVGIKDLLFNSCLTYPLKSLLNWHKTIFLSGLLLLTACTTTPLVKPPPQQIVILPTPVEKTPLIIKPSITPPPKSVPLIIPKAKPIPPPAVFHPTPLSAVEIALLETANKSSQSGDLEAASASLERALRINPRNAELTYRLAELRLKQGQPHLAEDLANKAAFLAGNDSVLKKRCLLLIEQAKKE